MASENDKKGSTQTEKKVPIENPYRPYDLLSGNWPYHDNVIKKIKEIFEKNPENKFVVLQGILGSGKTSTLKQLENSPNLIGKNYTPIYLNSKNYIDFDSDDLLFAVNNDIIEKMNKYGIRIPKPDLIKERRRKGKTGEDYFLVIQGSLPKDRILLLIFDEFDSLLENIDAKIISEYIRLFKLIENPSWYNYALIFVSDRVLTKITSDEIINKTLDTFPIINIEDIFDREVIKAFILKPVKNQLTYDEDALERIIWYSGKNLYFQQLICHHLVNHLNEKNKNQCSADDVEIVVTKILSEERPEFIYTWENKLSVEARLLASALTNDTVIHNKEQFYFLKENSLLDDIFGEEVFTHIKKYQDFGYFNPIQGRRFSQYPFKIPMYGKWIQKERPFIRTIIENIEFIASKIDLKTIIKILRETPDDQLLPFNFNKEPILGIAEKWLSIIKNIAIRPINDSKIVEYRASVRWSMENFLKSLSALLNFNIKIASKEKYFIIDIKDLRISILEEAICFIQDRPELTKSDIFNIERIATALAQDTQTTLTLFIHFRSSEMMEEIVKKGYLNLIAIDENNIKKIILSRRPSEVFRKIILSKLSLQKISPYQTEGPTKATFYGRSNIINEITRPAESSYTVVGARKIGKSSLLHKINENPPPNTIYIFMDLEVEFSNVKNYKTFLKSLEFEIKRRFYKEVSFNRFPFGKHVSKLPEIFRGLFQKGEKIVLIFDEIDSLIEFDSKRKYKLMRIFRTMSQKNYCQFIFSGFKELYHQKRNIENPMYNFCEEIMLKPLDRESALDLITKPMENIGIRYKNIEDRELILGYTSCHPSLLQFFCKHLIEKVEKHENIEERRTISIEDIEEIFDTDYEKYIMEDIYMFFSDLSAINKLILLLLVESPLNKKNFSIKDISDLLISHGVKISINDIHKNLRNLVIRFILVDKGIDNYQFALPVFPEILKKRIEDYKDRIIKEVKGNETKSL